MGKRIIISEEEKKNIKSLYEDFRGLKDGKIEYVTSNGETVLYRITHPMSDFKVISFDIKTGEFKLDGNFVAGDPEGTISPEKLKIITDNMDSVVEKFEIPVGNGKKNTEITFEKVK